MTKKRKFIIGAGTLVFLFAIYVVVALGGARYPISNPVEGATNADYNPASFWHPWGDHNHRGIDIFAPKGTKVRAVRRGIVIWTGYGPFGGKNVAVLDGKGYITYYAHLSKINTFIGAAVTPHSVIGRVGDTGNAKGKPSHLHFSESSFFKPHRLSYHYDKKYHAYFTNPVDELK
jgi:murein DD-endopeptidase MepM/ murein hydrolase activator NlpD